MAVRFVLVYVVAMVALCVIIVGISDCMYGFGCIHAEAASPEKQIRKLLHGSEEMFKSLGPLDRGDKSNAVGWALRAVPSGPDPLHHNGSGPKKPQTP